MNFPPFLSLRTGMSLRKSTRTNLSASSADRPVRCMYSFFAASIDLLSWFSFSVYGLPPTDFLSFFFFLTLMPPNNGCTNSPLPKPFPSTPEQLAAPPPAAPSSLILPSASGNKISYKASSFSLKRSFGTEYFTIILAVCGFPSASWSSIVIFLVMTLLSTKALISLFLSKPFWVNIISGSAPVGSSNNAAKNFLIFALNLN